MTLSYTDGHRGRAEAPMTKGTAYQLIVEEVRAKPDMVTGMYSFYDYVILSLCSYCYSCC